MQSDPEILEPPQRRRLGTVAGPVRPPVPDVMPEDVSPSPTSPASFMIPEDNEIQEIDDDDGTFRPPPESPLPAEPQQQAGHPQPAELPLPPDLPQPADENEPSMEPPHPATPPKPSGPGLDSNWILPRWHCISLLVLRTSEA